MNVVTPVSYTTPDGVERKVRSSLGAQKRVTERFGDNLQAALNKHGAAMLAELLYLYLYDEKQNPPKDLTVAELEEMLPSSQESLVEILSVIGSANTQGAIDKKNFAERIRAALQKAAEQLNTGSESGVSLELFSDLIQPSSGASLGGSSTLSENGTASSTASNGNGLDSSPHKSPTPSEAEVAAQ